MTASPSPGPSHPLSRTSILAAAVGLATLLGGSSVALVYGGMNAWGRTYSFQRALIAGLPDWYFWAAATPLVFWLAERGRIERSGWLRAGCFHLAAGTLVALAQLGLVTGFNRLVGTPSYAGSLLDAYLRIFLQYFHLHLMVYAVIVAAAHAVRYYRSYRSQELESARLQTELSQAHLAALQMQLQPHFFFNTLHTIATLVRDGRGQAATDTLARLGDLFRETLGNGKQNETCLRDELRFVDAYLDIERMRFADRLVVRVEADPDVLDARIPSMALQPLVENAIRHGIARDPAARLVALHASRHNGTLRIEVSNEGPRLGSVTPKPGADRVGLGNVRARLQRLYGTGGRLELVPGEVSGTVAIMELPYRREPVP